jgi:hypothetical protein
MDDNLADPRPEREPDQQPGPDLGQRRAREILEKDEDVPEPPAAGQPRNGASGERGDSRTIDDGHSPGDDLPESDRRPDVTADEAEQRFKETIRGLRIVQDFGTNKVIGVARRQPGSLSWQITRLESPAENAGRQAAIDLLTDLVVQAADGFAALPTDLDEAVAATEAVADPSSIALKLCNAAGQALAHHLGLGVIAPALGSFVEQTLKREVDPSSGQPGVVQALGVFGVTVDVATGQLTPAAYEFAAAALNSMLQDKTRGISQAELNKIQAAIRARRSQG